MSQAWAGLRLGQFLRLVLASPTLVSVGSYPFSALLPLDNAPAPIKIKIETLMPKEELPLITDLRNALYAAQAKGRSLNEVARLSGVSAAQLSRFLSGERTLTLPAVAKLCAYLGLRLKRDRCQRVFQRKDSVMSEQLQFKQIVERLPRAPQLPTGPNLSIPGPVDPFVPPTTTIDQGPTEGNPLDSDLLLFTAPAAVGKSTFARALAAQAQVPLLDLAKVGVSTNSLRGTIGDEMGETATSAFQAGQFALIIDALDEGRILSTDKHLEDFLRTTFQFLLKNPSAPKGRGPKLLLFGRREVMGDVAALLELEAPDLPVTRLTIDYFDETSATDLVVAYVKNVAGEEHLQQFGRIIRQVIRAFFQAISKAIGTPSEGLWQDPNGRSFAGYAPVLAALGTLIAKTEKYQLLQQRLEASGVSNAWEVLDQVTGEVLERETDKVLSPLITRFPKDVPPEAYDSIDQLDLLARHLLRQPFRVSPRLAFGSPDASAGYREAVGTHLKEHPFVRSGLPANDVLGSLVLAHAIATGADTSGGEGPRLLRTYGRQPFLWRFLRCRLSPDGLINGDVLAYLLGSLWSDDSLIPVSITPGMAEGDPPRLRIDLKGQAIEVGMACPLVLMREVRNLTVDLPGDEIIMRRWPGTDAAIRLLGRSTLHAQTMTFDLDRVHVGARSVPASCHLHADAVNDQGLTLEVQTGSRLTVEGAFVGRYPWDSFATLVPPPPSGDDLLYQLLVDCERRIVGEPSLVVLENYDLPDGPLEWARKYGQLLPGLLRALVEHDLASANKIQTKGDTKIRVRPNIRWPALREAYENSSTTNERLRAVFDQLH